MGCTTAYANVPSRPLASSRRSAESSTLGAPQPEWEKVLLEPPRARPQADRLGLNLDTTCKRAAKPREKAISADSLSDARTQTMFVWQNHKRAPSACITCSKLLCLKPSCEEAQSASISCSGAQAQRQKERPHLRNRLFLGIWQKSQARLRPILLSNFLPVTVESRPAGITLKKPH